MSMIPRRPSYEPIATAIVEVHTDDGTFLPAEIRIGRPYAEDTHWACPVELQGIAPRPLDARGETAIQALVLALAKARMTLDAAIEQGMRIRHPGAFDMISAEWLEMLFFGCGAPGAGGSAGKVFDDPEWQAAIKVRHVSAQSLLELQQLLPNGFHDAMLHWLHLDIVRRRVIMELDIWVDDPAQPVFQERYRRAVIQISLAGRCVVEPPDPRYPFREAKPVRVDLDVSRKASESSPEEARFFVDAWNSFIVVEDDGALLTWLDKMDVEQRGGDAPA